MNENVGAEPLIVSVSEFSHRLKGVFRQVRPFARLGVSGEISEWRENQYGVGFTLKDEKAVLKCFAFSNAAKSFPFVENGAAVTAIGSVEVQERWGYYQLLVNEIRPTGQGELHRRYLELKEKFRAEGLFDEARKKAIPAFPLHVALISARQGKGAEDFARAMRESVPFVRVTTIETRVQGEGAEIDIREALDRADKTGADVIVLARGGGSYEDLFPFNLEPVVRAIVRAAIPVITAIGHSDDRHIADDAADISFGTPSLAAEHIVKNWGAGRNRLATGEARLAREANALRAQWVQRVAGAFDALKGVPRFVERRRQLVAQREMRLAARSPQRRVAEMRAGFASTKTKLDGSVRRILDARKNVVAMREQRLTGVRGRPVAEKERALERCAARLDSLSPEGPLERGYAIVSLAGEPLRDAAKVHPGQEISARLWRGSITARIERTETDT